MKKAIALLLALAALLAFAACAQTVTPTQAPAAETVYVPALRFTTTDRAGNAADETIFAGYKLIMLNFWEPWCGPCVREMPDLEKLWQTYGDQGLLIVGVYSTEGVDDQVDAVLESAGTSYPILRYTEAFDQFRTGYVPTTVFLNSEGSAVSELLVGSRDYAGWEELIKTVLK